MGDAGFAGRPPVFLGGNLSCNALPHHVTARRAPILQASGPRKDRERGMCKQPDSRRAKVCRHLECSVDGGV